LNQQLPRVQKIVLAMVMGLIVGAAMVLALLNALGMLPIR
jgi:hypothetical protein